MTRLTNSHKRRLLKLRPSASSMLGLLVILSLIPLACAEDEQAEYRTWTDATGAYTVEAAFVEFKAGNVHLKRKDDGRVVTVPSSQLSKEDQQFVRDLLRSRRPSTGSRSTTGSGGSRPMNVASGDWAQWRGPNRDGICTETGLSDQWADGAPPLLWQIDGLGSGYSSVSIARGKIYTMGRRGGQTSLICLDVQGGNRLWATPVGGGGDPNCTPTVDPDANLVFALSHGGDLLCADAQSGREAWRKNFGRDFGGRMMSQWGYSESPLVDGDRLICTPGASQAMLAALEKQSGRVIWTTAARNLGSAGKDGAGYSSIVVSNGAGVRQYVQLVGRGVIGVAAEDGTLLWSYNRIANDTANIPTPLVKDDFVFCSTGYDDGGSALLQLAGSGRGVQVREVYYRRSRDLQNHHGGMVLVGNHIYFGHGHNRGLPVCVELRSGRLEWGPGRGPGSGSAAVLYADGHLYFRYEDGVMALVEATPSGFNLKGTFRIASNQGKSWPHPVIADGRLYLRDQDALLCYDVRRQ